MDLALNSSAGERWKSSPLSARGAIEVVEEAVAPLRPVRPDRDRAAAFMVTGLSAALLGIWLARSGQETLTVAVAT
jgi:hypothetical protein